MTLHLSPDVIAGLEALATSEGLSVEDYLQHLVERKRSATTAESAPSEGSGMVWENGLLVYRTGKPLPAHVVDDVIRRSREERSQRILGNLS
jgi:hypothetical protein